MVVTREKTMKVPRKSQLGGTGSVKRIVRLAPGLLEDEERPPHDEVEWRFNMDPLLEQMPDLCSKFDLDFAEEGDEGDYYVLTAGPDPSSATLKNVADLISLDADEDAFRVLYVNKGADVVDERLGSLEDALEDYKSDSSHQALQAVRVTLSSFLKTIRGEIWLTEESIFNDAMLPVFQAAECSKEVSEQAMACIGELCQSSCGFEWLSERPDTLSSSFFEHIFQVLFPSPEEEAENSKAGSHREHPWATLYTTCFLLHDCLPCLQAAHQAACKKAPGGDDLTMYGEMIESVDSSDDFKATAAMGVLSSMVLACQKVPELEPRMLQEFIRDGDDGFGEDLFKNCGDNQTLVKSMLAASMYHCTEQRVVLKSVQETATMKKTIRNLRAEISQMKDDYLKRHSVMMKMLTYVKTDAYPIVQRSLPSIIKLGWDALQWQRGYSLLHYAAEMVDDPDLVELIGLLSTDIDARDSNHMRPIDFARRRDNEDIIDIIQKLRDDRNGIVGEKRKKKIKRKNGQKLKEEFEQLEGLSAELKAEIEQVLDFGWDPTAWHGKFSPVHRAAKCGHVEAIKFLAELGAELCSTDGLKFTPVDYANQGNHEAVVRAVQELMGAGPPDTAKPVEAKGDDDRKREDKKPPKAGDGGQHTEAPGDDGSKQQESKSPEAPTAAGQAEQPSGKKATPEQPSPKSSKLAVPSGLHPQLQNACNVVQKKGWGQVTWPKGFTALHLAAKLGSEDGIKFLLQATAMPTLEAKDQKGKTPLEYAKDSGHTEVWKLESLLNPETAAKCAGRDSAPTLSEGKEATPTTVTKAAAPTQDDKAAARKPRRQSDPTAGQQLITGIEPGSTQRRNTVQSFKELVRSGIAAKKAMTAVTGKENVPQMLELLKERVKSHNDAQEGRSVNELKAEIKRLRAEEKAWHAERNKLLSAGASAGASAGGVGAGAGHGVLGGSLTAAQMSKYLKELEIFGKDKVRQKLMETELTGGLMLDERQAVYALGQLELVKQIISGDAAEEGAQGGAAFPKGPPAVLAAADVPAVPPQQPAQSKEQDPPAASGEPDPAVAAAAPEPKAAKGKGKAGKAGKGGPPAAPAAAEPPAAETPAPAPPAADAPPKAGKGPGKGGKKGPPAPGAAPPAAEEEAKAAAPAPAGKAGKGPAKGPGKGGPAAPGGKGPPAGPAGGKGPPGPGGGKGPGAPGGAPGKAKAKAKAGAVEPTKPAVKPGKSMKPLWWTKMLMGAQLKPGETIWDKVEDLHSSLDIEELEARFSKATVERKAKKEDGEKKEKKAEVKILRIITDQNEVLQKETGLRKLPPPDEVAKAVQELDDSFDVELLRGVQKNAVPDPGQWAALQKARSEEPNIPMGLCEQYMWVIGNLVANKQRLDCWVFIRTYKESHAQFTDALSNFKAIVEAFLKEDSKLPPLLGLVLAVGNYLNGGTNRGQADGFDLETLSKLDGIKDGSNKDIRDFIFSKFFQDDKFKDNAQALIKELTPLWMNVTRRLGKDSEGTEKLSKSTRINLEDFDMLIQDLNKSFEETHESMTMIMQYFEDPTEPFRLHMPGKMAKAKKDMEELMELKTTVKDQYANLLKAFKIQAMKSTDFCMTWDNFLLPGDLIVNADKKRKEEYLVPTFCKDKPFSLHDLKVLWSFVALEDVAKKHGSPKKGAESQHKEHKEHKEGEREDSRKVTHANTLQKKAGAHTGRNRGGRARREFQGGKDHDKAVPADPIAADLAAFRGETPAEVADNATNDAP